VQKGQSFSEITGQACLNEILDAGPWMLDEIRMFLVFIKHRATSNQHRLDEGTKCETKLKPCLVPARPGYLT